MDTLAGSLSAQAISDDLATRTLGRRVVYLPTAASTNDVARQLAEAGEPEGTLVIADEQTAGRGRMARAWLAPARSSILMSLILRPSLAPAHLARVAIATALGACDAIHRQTDLLPRLKWPNDILVSGHKCGGILSEADIVEGQVQCVIVGLGLNVNFHAAAVPGIPPDATTLADQLGKPVGRVALVRAILEAVEPYYARICNGESLRLEWATRLDTLRRPIHAHTPWGDETGIAEDVDADGALLLRRADNSLVRLTAADVTLKRDA